MCSSGIAFSGIFLYLFLKRSYFKFILKVDEKLKRKFEQKVLMPVVAFSFAGAVVAYMAESFQSGIH